MRDPNYEVYQFSDASRSLEVGLSLKGTGWDRPNDTVGLAEMLDGLGHAQKEYFNDGWARNSDRGWQTAPLRSGERYRGILQLRTFQRYKVSLDYQLAADPAFNKDRGPINIFSARGQIKL